MEKYYFFLFFLFINTYSFAEDGDNHKLIVIGEASNRVEKITDLHADHKSFTSDILTETGVQETRKIAKDLKSKGFNSNNISAVLISPLPGSVQTADLLAQEGLFNKEKIKIDNRLIERQTISSPDKDKIYITGFYRVESDIQINTRLQDLIDSLAKQYREGNVVIISQVPIAQSLIDLLSSKEKLKAGEAQVLSIPQPQTTPNERPAGSEEDIIIQWAEHNLLQTGVLKEEKKGFVYLKVDDNYINKLIQFVIDPRYIKPPYFRRPDSPGAHISVIYRDERRRTGPIKEIGRTYSFQLTKLAKVPLKTGKYLVLQVYAPELEQLRKKYGLSPLLKGHDFHITIAEKKG